MRTLKIERPNDKQQLFLRATAKHVGFGGARGGGKSWAVKKNKKFSKALSAYGLLSIYSSLVVEWVENNTYSTQYKTTPSRV